MPLGIFKYDWAEVQRYYDEGNGFVQCCERFGFAKDTWIKAIRRGSIVVRGREWPLDKVLRESKSRYTVTRRLLKAGLLQGSCDECGISEWRGQSLAIQLDHRNGVRDDHRLENLRMLCPNCHTQTETYAAKNRRCNRRRSARAVVVTASLMKRNESTAQALDALPPQHPSEPA